MSGYRQPYTVEEERKILHYIFRRNAFYRLRGLQFWKEVSRDVLPNRTHQSLHERFRKYIIHNINNSAYNLSMEEQIKLKTIFDELARGKRGVNKRSKPSAAGFASEVHGVLARDFIEFSDSDDEDANATSAIASRVNTTCRQTSTAISSDSTSRVVTNHNLRNEDMNSGNSSTSDSEIFDLNTAATEGQKNDMG